MYAFLHHRYKKTPSQPGNDLPRDPLPESQVKPALPEDGIPLLMPYGMYGLKFFCKASPPRCQDNSLSDYDNREAAEEALRLLSILLDK